jgi:stage II sporulation protein D
MTATPPHPPRYRGARVRKAGAAACAALAACLGIALFTSVAPAGATETTMFNISGRGWGHGIGMCQWGAYGYAKHGWMYKQILSHYYTGISYGTVANRQVRVLLNEGQSSVRVSSATPFKAVGGAGTITVPAGTTAVVTWSAGSYALSAGSQSFTSAAPILVAPGHARLMLANKNMSGLPSVNMHYRGQLRVVRLNSGLSTINVIRVEDYLRGVVPREVSSSWPAEALKAQAVAARSYAAIHFGSSGAYDLYCDTRSQAYNGADGEAASTNAAVTATRGVVPIYAGKPISAFFFSTSGGHTENIENVWGTSPVPYLKGVDDPYDTYSPFHIWPDNPIRKTGAAVAAALGSTYLPGGTLQTIYVVRSGVSPRVVVADAVGSSGVKALSGATLRVRLGLRDTWFTVRTLSIDPGTAAGAAGQSAPLTGRIFPALAAGETLTLHSQVSGGAWRTSAVAAGSITAGSVRLPGGKTAKYSAYTVGISPTAKSSYYVSVGTDQSPRVTLGMRASASLQAAPTAPTVGEPVTFTATVLPQSLAGTTVTFQTLTNGTWTTVAQAALGADGTCTFQWTAAAAGTFSFRLLVPAAKGLPAATSATFTLTVGGSPGPSPSPSPSPSSSPTPTPAPSPSTPSPTPSLRR